MAQLEAQKKGYRSVFDHVHPARPIEAACRPTPLTDTCQLDPLTYVSMNVNNSREANDMPLFFLVMPAFGNHHMDCYRLRHEQ